MEFKKKLKTRLLLHITLGILGLALVLFALLSKTENSFVFSYGIALMVLSVIRTIQYRKIAADAKALRQQELAETDERYHMMVERAKSWAFSFWLMLSGIAVIVLSLLDRHDQALPIAWSVCGMTALYALCYLVIRKKY